MIYEAMRDFATNELLPLSQNELNKKDEKCELYPLEVNYCSKCHNCQLSVAVNPKKMFSNYLLVVYLNLQNKRCL